MEEIVYLSIRFGCTAYLLYKVWKQKERIGKICDLLYTPRNRPQAEKDNGEPGNAQDVMGYPICLSGRECREDRRSLHEPATGNRK